MVVDILRMNYMVNHVDNIGMHTLLCHYIGGVTLETGWTLIYTTLTHAADLIVLHLTYQLSSSVSSSSEVRMTTIPFSTGRARISLVIVLLLTWMEDVQRA
jgi:hypothetical protein